MLLPVFIILLSNRTALGYIEYVTDLRDYKKVNKTMAYIFTLVLFSLSGFPPLLGFFGKFLILDLLGHFSLYNLIIFLLISSMLNIYYHVRFIKVMFFNNSYEYSNHYISSAVPVTNYTNAIILVTTSSFLLLGVFYLDIIINISYKIIVYLFIQYVLYDNTLKKYFYG